MTVYDCVVFWNGFPACGHMLKDLSNKLGNKLKVYATRPAVPFVGLGAFLKNEIAYVNSPSELLSEFQKIREAKCFIHTGWCYREINRIDAKLKKLGSQTKVLIMVDNRLRYNIRQVIGALYFRLKLRKLYDGYIVAGSNAAKLMSFLGASSEQVASGHYGAPSDLYPRWDGIQEKAKQFTFVGSLDKRKGADILLEAWSRYKAGGGKWTLKILGDGPYMDRLKILSDVNCFGFQQPSEVSRHLLNSYAFVLPGRDDHWGTVVAEAAASGCIVVSTKNVAASHDVILENKNGYVLDFLSPTSLCEALFRIEKLSDLEMQSMCKRSVEVSNRFDSNRLTEAIFKLVTL